MFKSLWGAAALALALATGAASAQQFPSKPITLVCPYPPGGASDLMVRTFAEALSRQLNQSVVVENRSGASGSMGAAALANAKGDGYTLALLPISVLRVPHLNKTAYDPLKDITYIINVAGYSLGMVVRADAPWKNIQELVNHAKANPGALSYASSGTGTTPQLAVEQFAFKAGIKLNHIPYKGFGESLQSLLGGHTMALTDSSGWAPHVDAGAVRLLATYGSKRTKRWPQVPTLQELGYETVSDSPVGFGGPKDMDPKVVKILHDAFRKAMDDPKVQAMLEKADMPPLYMSTEAYTAWARKTFAEEKVLLQRLGMAKP